MKTKKIMGAFCRESRHRPVLFAVLLCVCCVLLAACDSDGDKGSRTVQVTPVQAIPVAVTDAPYATNYIYPKQTGLPYQTNVPYQTNIPYQTNVPYQTGNPYQQWPAATSVPQGNSGINGNWSVTAADSQRMEGAEVNGQITGDTVFSFLPDGTYNASQNLYYGGNYTGVKNSQGTYTYENGLLTLSGYSEPFSCFENGNSLILVKSDNTQILLGRVN